ncbi:helix-turn-helix domain-containing protein [Pseudomonas amygdali]
MEYLVILHTAQGDVRTRYPRHKQAQAIAHWHDYAATGKKASLIGGVSRNPGKFRRKTSPERFTAAFAIRHGFPYMFWPLNQTVFGLATSQPENNCLASIRTSTGFPPMTEISGIPAYNPDLIRLRTREGMAIARAKGKLRGKKPKLSDRQQKELRRMHDSGEYSISDLAEVFSISRPTVYRTLARQSIGVAAT